MQGKIQFRTQIPELAVESEAPRSQFKQLMISVCASSGAGRETYAFDGGGNRKVWESSID